MLRFPTSLALAALVCVGATVPAHGASALSPAEIAALLSSPTRRVRAADPTIERYLAEGLRRSSTFCDLVLALNQSDVIVYIQSAPQLPTTLSGRLLLMPGPSHQRYLRIQIRSGASGNEMISTIGHELRHAVEIADAPDVSDERALIRLYERIGERGNGPHKYDTLAAQTTGKRVRMEL
jgi:hypothetical protein